MRVKSLNYYPVKSCSGIALQEAEVGLRGFKNDRIAMLIDDDGVFMSQRKHPKLALILTSMTKNELCLRVNNIFSITIELQAVGKQHLVSVWGDTCQGIDQGDEVARTLSEFLSVSCRLMVMAEGFHRALDSNYYLQANDQTGFADGFPFLLLSQASLDDLNSRLVEPVSMNRFRPNIVIEDCEPYQEDNWRRIRIGKLEFEIVKPCVRCGMTTINQLTLEKSKQPLKELANYRYNKELGGVTFGQNLIQCGVGEIRIGQPVSILEKL